MRTRKITTIFIIGFVALSGLLVMNNFIPFGAAADRTSHPTANVLLLTNNSINDENAVWVSLGLDEKIITIPYLNPDASDGNETADLYALDFSTIDCVIVDSYLPSGADLDYLLNNINGTTESTGLLFFGGSYSETTILNKQLTNLLPVEFSIRKTVLNETIYDLYENQTGTVTNPISEYFNYVYDNTEAYEVENDEIQVDVSEDQDSLDEADQSMYVTRIAWQSCPLLYQRILTYNTKTDDGALTLVEVPNTGEPLVSEWYYDSNPDIEVIYVSPGTADIWAENDDGEMELDEWNTPFHLWPYFNYMLYMMVFDVANIDNFDDAQIESYADWPYSPIPHQTEAIIWMIFVGALWVFNFVLFFTLGRKKNKRDAAAPVADVVSDKEKDEKPVETSEATKPEDSSSE